MAKKKSSIWKCDFCNCHLVRNSFRGPEWLLLLLLHRPHYCPHCFKVYYRLMCPISVKDKRGYVEVPSDTEPTDDEAGGSQPSMPALG